MGIDANIAILIAYLGGVVLGWIPGLNYLAWLVPLIVFILEKDSKFVRFHAMQSFAISLVGLLFAVILSILTAIFVATLHYSPGSGLGLLGLIATLGTIVSIVILVFAVIAIIQGFQYKEYKIPVIGNLAVKMAELTEKKVHKG
ncbi:MAG: DUF4870 domain-containing protein [Firmicutes bacterium]|nr:DUF4870 domain-containing protein [Bacillota bacterium]